MTTDEMKAQIEAKWCVVFRCYRCDGFWFASVEEGMDDESKADVAKYEAEGCKKDRVPASEVRHPNWCECTKTVYKPNPQRVRAGIAK